MSGHLRGDARKRLAEDTSTRHESDAADHAALLGRIEWFGECGGDDTPCFDESKLCRRCEHGHGEHVCARCSGAAS